MILHLKKDWIYIDFKKFLYINLENPFKTMNKLRGIFKPLKRYFKWGKTWNPILWCSKPSLIHIMTSNVSWKDKYNAPRYEGPPYIWIHLFKFNLVWYWDLDNCFKLNPINNIEDYWEQALWYLYYYDNISYGCNFPNLQKAKESWPWKNVEGISNWTDIYLEK